MTERSTCLAPAYKWLRPRRVLNLNPDVSLFCFSLLAYPVRSMIALENLSRTLLKSISRISRIEQHARNGVCDQIDQRTKEFFTFLTELDRLGTLRSLCRPKDDVLMSVIVLMSVSSLRTMSVSEVVGFVYCISPNYTLWYVPSAGRIT